ncbi:hypothetical protein MUK42_14213 [Musa troglodytarum]|uniref:Uncharacterized protein n=1 Tax=Musa troglodytarum TaxID=320322 RepID=A0A9E7L986_9LILI|nr:hypothetical protein MUK42_14213 [Musa troglodytarum]
MMRRRSAHRPPKRVGSRLSPRAARLCRGRRGRCCSASGSYGRDRSRWLHEKGSCSERRGVLASQLIDFVHSHLFCSSCALQCKPKYIPKNMYFFYNNKESYTRNKTNICSLSILHETTPT